MMMMLYAGSQINASRIRAARQCIHRGFTLIETALATVIVGVGVLSIMSAQQAFHTQNSWSTHASTATRLGNEIREMTLNLPRHDPVIGSVNWGIEEDTESSVADFDDLDDFDGTGDGLVLSAESDPINGPLNARREIIPNMDGWTQEIYVENINPLDISEVVGDGTSNMIRVRVVVTYQGPGETEPQVMTTVSWIAPN